MFVGIDPSISNTGVVVINNTGSLVAVYNSKFDSKSNELCEIVKYSRIAAHITDFVKACCSSITPRIGYEDYSYGSIHRGYSLAEFGGILKYYLYSMYDNVKITLLAPTVVKKYATGNGNATKSMVSDAAYIECPELKFLPKKQQTKDVCDAYFMARIMLSLYTNGTPPETNQNLLRTRMELCRKLSGMEGLNGQCTCQ